MNEVRKLLNKYAEKKYSQFGEDGILNEIINRIDNNKLINGVLNLEQKMEF